jgi:hypothetical protein
MARRKQAKTRIGAETPLFYPKGLEPSPSRSPLRSDAILKATILGKVIFTWPGNVASSIHTAEWGSTNRSFYDQKKVLGGTHFHNPPPSTRKTMAIIPQTPLFSWHEIEASSDLDRLALVLSVLPDEELMHLLERNRGRGRNDYPVRPTWNALIAGVVYDHPTIASLRRELCRNGELRQMCGFDVGAGANAVPSDDAFSRFVALLMDHQPLIVRMFHKLVDALKQKLPRLGQKLAVDSKAIRSYGRPVSDRDQEADGRRDMDADWGAKTYKGKRKDGTTWQKVKRWFGYKLHLLVDSVYELPLAYEVTPASAGDQPHLLPLVDELEEGHSDIAETAEELSADKGYDSAEIKAALYDDHDIKPVIDTRQLWQDERGEPRPLYPDRADVFVYNELGEVFCHCPSERRDEQQTRQLAFVGYEKDRNTLKYRCPAAYYGLDCPGRETCEANTNVGDYGRVVRIPLERNRRIFTPVARCSQKWEKAYARRTAVERVNSRVDKLLGFEHHTIRGQAKMEMRMGLALVVMLAMALGRIRAGQAEQMRSLRGPIRRAA